MDEERTWDLSVLLKDTSIEGLTKNLEESLAEIQAILDKLQSGKKKMSATRFVKHLREYEEALEGGYTIAGYSYCKYVSDTTAEGSQAYASVSSRCFNEGERLRRSLLQILGNVLLENPSIVETQEFENYRYLLEKASKNLPHILSPIEEALVAEKDTNGISAISELYQSWVGSQILDVEIGGKKKSLSMNEAFSLLMAEERETRKIVSEAYFGSFAKDKLLHGTALRAICSDHVNMTKRRKWSSFMTQSLIDQDVDEGTISALLATLETRSTSLQKYIHLKAEYFGQERLLEYDLRAPWVSKPVWNMDWTEVKSSVRKAYQEFDDEIGNFVNGLFQKRQIDSEKKPGRANTAFCFPFFERKTSFVFVTYTGSLNDAYIVAHELGHAVHSYFTDTHQSMLNTEYSSCLAETSSIFGELLFTEQLMKECDNDDLRLEILAKVLDRFYQWSFHIGSYALFEKDLYEFIGAGGFLDTDKACEIWRNNRHKIYGDTVEWSENLDYDWARWGQFFRPNYRFYNYSYSFAQLLVFALYKDYKKSKSDFNDRFKRLLSRGSIMSPRDQIAELGFDITKPDFWNRGIKQAESFLDDLKKLL